MGIEKKENARISFDSYSHLFAKNIYAIIKWQQSARISYMLCHATMPCRAVPCRCMESMDALTYLIR